MTKRNSHINDVIEDMKSRDEDAIWLAIEKLAVWVLDKNGAALNRAEFAEEIAGMIEHRSACIRDEQEESKTYSHIEQDEEHA